MDMNTEHNVDAEKRKDRIRVGIVVLLIVGLFVADVILGSQKGENDSIPTTTSTTYWLEVPGGCRGVDRLAYSEWYLSQVDSPSKFNKVLSDLRPILRKYYYWLSYEYPSSSTPEYVAESEYDRCSDGKIYFKVITTN